MSGENGSAPAFTLPRRSFALSESPQNVTGNGVDVRGFLALRRVRAVLRLPSDRRLRRRGDLVLRFLFKAASSAKRYFPPAFASADFNASP